MARVRLFYIDIHPLFLHAADDFPWGRAFRSRVSQVSRMPNAIVSKVRGTLPALAGALLSGLWVLFFCLLAAAAVLAATKAGHLFYLVENFNVDSYDTILSVQAFHSFGPLADIPWFTVPDRLFGNFPILFPFLGSVIDMAFNNASTSTTILYWATDITIAALLWTRFLKHCDWKTRLLFCVFFTVDMFIGNLFPLGFRKRQALAILAGMGMFLADRAALSGAFAFLALLAQPFTGAALLLMKAADMAGRKPLRSWSAGDIALLLVPLLCAYPFYAGLVQSVFQAPSLSVLSPMTESFSLPFEILGIFVFAALWIGNGRKYEPMRLLAFVMLFIMLALPVVLILFRDALPEGIASALHSVASSIVPDIQFNVIALGLVVGLWRDKALPSMMSVAIVILVSVLSLSMLVNYLFAETTVVPEHEAAFRALANANITILKTLELTPVEYSGAVHLVPFCPLFNLQGYGILHGWNITFLGETDLPPPLSRGGSNVLSAELPQAIYDRNSTECRELVSGLEAYGVQGLQYTFSQDITMRGISWRGHFTDQAFLGQCGVELLTDSNDDESLMVLYRIKQAG
jgi:hypothetical protein